MNKFYLLILFVLTCFPLLSQELDSQVVVNARQTGQVNISVFQTLENALTEFLNQTKWTEKEFLPHERIDCSFFITIQEYDGNSFSGSIQVQSSRPVFGSTMISPVFNYKDEDLNFTYTEFEPLRLSLNDYNSELVSVVSFYVYMILGMDADTFMEQGGTDYYETASQIASVAQEGGRSGWKTVNGSATRNRLITELLSNAYTGYRDVLYAYHRNGLDRMHFSPSEGKKAIAEAILDLERINSGRPNSLLIRTFFDAKADEVQQIFSGGPSVPISEVVDALNNMAPTFSANWSNIRY